MKQILVYILLVLAFVSSNASQENYFNPEYQLGEEGLYGRLPFGYNDDTTQFAYNQIKDMAVLIRNSSGKQPSGQEAIAFNILEETLEDVTKRVANMELNRVLSVMGWDPKETYSIEVGFFNGSGRAQFTTKVRKFQPVFTGEKFCVPEETLANPEFIRIDGVGGTMNIHWPGIQRASLVVLGRDGSRTYSGDSSTIKNVNDPNLFVSVNSNLKISRRFATNGFTGVLNVLIKKDGVLVSGSYSITSGYTGYPPPTPLLDLQIINGQPTLKIVGGTPGTSLTILTRANLDQPADSHSIVLDNIGMATWLFDREAPSRFITVVTPTEEKRQP